MGIETALAIGGLALATVSSGVSMMQGAQAAQSQAAAAQRQFEFQDAELTRQQAEINRVAEEDKSDITRQADRTLGSIRAAAAELGASGSTSYVRMLTELGGIEGLDLSRIERNRKEGVASAQSSKTTAAISGQNTVKQAQNKQTAKIADSVLGFVGTGLQIGKDYYRRQDELDRLQNPTGDRP